MFVLSYIHFRFISTNTSNLLHLKVCFILMPIRIELYPLNRQQLLFSCNALIFKFSTRDNSSSYYFLVNEYHNSDETDMLDYFIMFW